MPCPDYVSDLFLCIIDSLIEINVCFKSQGGGYGGGGYGGGNYGNSGYGGGGGGGNCKYSWLHFQIKNK